jgi:hypothetical protein
MLSGTCSSEELECVPMDRVCRVLSGHVARIDSMDPTANLTWMAGWILNLAD